MKSSAAEAIAAVKKGRTIFIGSGAAEPVTLVEELVRQSSRFADNRVVHLLTLGPAPYVAPEYQDVFRHQAFFIGPNVRAAVNEGRADYVPVFLSQIPDLIRSRRFPIDVALITVSPPDEFGYVNLGISVDVVLAAVQAAELVIAEVTPSMPVVHGGGFLRVDEIDHLVWTDRAILEVEREPLDEVALEIGRNVASLVEDGSTLQVGIGQIPDATLRALTDKKDLGVWTEMFSDGVVDLVENGNITGRYKEIHPGKVTSSFTFGTRRVYDFVNRNPVFTFHPSDYVNDPIRIARQHKMVAINAALQIDLTGQVCADSIGGKFYSGIGGQVDFIRGASMAPGGKPIIAVRSTAMRGEVSRIVATLDPGAGVVTSRGDVRYVVTEYGVADLLGKSVRDRALALISIAHPDFRAELLESAKERRYVFADQIAPRIYPRRFERKVLARNGKSVLMRPIRATDEEKLTDFFYRCSAETLYKRFMRVIPRVPHQARIYDLDVDYATEMPLVVETIETDTESELIGIGRYDRDEAKEEAEVSFVIRDDWQGQGLGTLLLRHLAEIAHGFGIEAFTAQVLGDNYQMMDVFHHSGLEVRSTLSNGVYEIRMPLRAGPTSPDRPRSD